VDCATDVFVKQGYRRTQMADVADALGVAKGTLYLYVESKEALFDLVVRYADEQRPFQKPPMLPVPTPMRGETLSYVRQRLAESSILPALSAALHKQRVVDVTTEAEGILRELYELVARNRNGLKVLDSSARDMPEIAALWFEGQRGGLISALSAYLDKRRRQLRSLPDTAVTARLVIETVVFWAAHRHWDPHPQKVEEAIARETVVQFLTHALVKDDS